MKHSSPPAVRWQSYSPITRQTLRSSLRSDTSNKVRLAMSLTSCWILGEYCLGAPSSGGVAMASEWVAGLVFSCLRAQRAGVCRWSCCLENKEKDKPSIRTLKHRVCKSFVKQGGWQTQYYREGKNAIMQRGWRLTETRVLTWFREDWCHGLHKKKSAKHKCPLWHHASIFQEECFSKNFERWSKLKEWRMHSMRQIK